MAVKYQSARYYGGDKKRSKGPHITEHNFTRHLHTAYKPPVGGHPNKIRKKGSLYGGQNSRKSWN